MPCEADDAAAMGVARRLELGRRAVRVLEFLDDKDLFQRVYTKLLQQRLLCARDVCVRACPRCAG